MGIGGVFLVEEIILRNSDGDELDHEELKKIEKRVNKKLKKMNIDKTWIFENMGIKVRTNDFNPTSFRGEPEQIIPHFLIIWQMVNNMGNIIDDFNIPFTFEYDSGVFKFCDDKLLVYHISCDHSTRVTHYDLHDIDNLNMVYNNTHGVIKSQKDSIKLIKEGINNGRSRLYTVSKLNRKTILIDVPNIRRGDVVWTYEDAWNDKHKNKQVWTGEISIPLDSTINYGVSSVPQEFTLNEFPDSRYFDDSLKSNLRWLNFTANDIIKIVPEEYYVVKITALDNREYKYKILSTENSSTRRKLYKELKLINGLSAMEGFDQNFSKTPSEDLEYEHW